ncbi:hypothetical protein QQF21_11175, partial [Lelliottia sp. V89_10]|nr:hypothetical protein [Lelliottia sp. V89_5]MDK9596166.1 hypothetical protein [Lelliottia sp. V89_10]
MYFDLRLVSIISHHKCDRYNRERLSFGLIQMNKSGIAAFLALITLSGTAHSALTLNADRLIYSEKEGDATVTIHSNENRA